MPGFIALVLAVLPRQNVRFLVILSMFKDQNHKFQYFFAYGPQIVENRHFWGYFDPPKASILI